MPDSPVYANWVTAALEAIAQHRWSRAEECLTRAIELAVEEAVEKARHAMVEEGRPTAEITAMWDRRWPGRSQVDTWHGWPTDEDYDRESRHAG